MDFAFSSDQQLVKNAARSFLDEHCTPAAVRALMDDPRGENEALWKEIAQLGWLGLALPEAHGGSGLGMVETALILEEMGRAAYPGPYLPTVLAALAIADAGTREQQEQWLPAFAAGDARATVALLDADLDWTAQAVAARAERRAGGWSLSGLKRVVPWAHTANVLVVPARIAERRGGTRGESTGDGLALFLVDATAPGLKLTPLASMDPTSRWVTVRLESVPVPASAVLGQPGAVTPVLERALERAAVGAAAEMLGAARRCLDMSVGYAKVREQFGQPIAHHQDVQFRLAEMSTEITTVRYATYHCLQYVEEYYSRVAAGERVPRPFREKVSRRSAQVKVAASEVASRVSEVACDIMGARGLAEGFRLEKGLRDAPIAEIYEGTNEIQRLVIGRELVQRGFYEW